MMVNTPPQRLADEVEKAVYAAARSNAKFSIGFGLKARDLATIFFAGLIHMRIGSYGEIINDKAGFLAVLVTFKRWFKYMNDKHVQNNLQQARKLVNPNFKDLIFCCIPPSVQISLGAPKYCRGQSIDLSAFSEDERRHYNLSKCNALRDVLNATNHKLTQDEITVIDHGCSVMLDMLRDGAVNVIDLNSWVSKRPGSWQKSRKKRVQTRIAQFEALAA